MAEEAESLHDEQTAGAEVMAHEQEQRVKDASGILIGKDPIQVAEAMSRASAMGAKETERVKDEL